MNKDIRGRGRSLEDAFFLQWEKELIESKRREEEIEERRKSLSEASGITDPKILDELAEHGLHAEVLASLALVPIIEVVWADGHMHQDERSAVLTAAEKHGIVKESPAHALIEHWLKKRPDTRLLTLWKEYMEVLLPTLSTEGQLLLKKSIIGHARDVAEAAGGFLGLGKISAEEKIMLKELEKVFKLADEEKQ